MNEEKIMKEAEEEDGGRSGVVTRPGDQPDGNQDGLIRPFICQRFLLTSHRIAAAAAAASGPGFGRETLQQAIRGIGTSQLRKARPVGRSMQPTRYQVPAA
jgi:hypothetical protein